MEKEIKTEIGINATPEKVWAALTDFDQYPFWNPFIKSITGEVRKGNKIRIRLEPPKAMGMVLHPTVLVFENQREFRWLGHLLFPGLFDGEHRFELTDNGNGTTTFKHSEKFKGMLVPLFIKMLDHKITPAFHLMNQGLKALVEQH